MSQTNQQKIYEISRHQLQQEYGEEVCDLVGRHGAVGVPETGVYGVLQSVATSFLQHIAPGDWYFFIARNIIYWN